MKSQLDVDIKRHNRILVCHSRATVYRLKGNANSFMFSSRILKLRTSIDLNQVLILNIYDNSNF